MRFAHPLVTNVLLLLVFLTLVMIWRRMPTTYGEYRDADSEDRQSVRERIPMVKVYGDVRTTIEDQPITVDVQNSLLDVNVR